MNDARGTEINVGDDVVYPMRITGTAVTLVQMRVAGFTPKMVKLEQPEDFKGKRFWLGGKTTARPDLVVVVSFPV